MSFWEWLCASLGGVRAWLTCLDLLQCTYALHFAFAQFTTLLHFCTYALHSAFAQSTTLLRFCTIALHFAFAPSTALLNLCYAMLEIKFIRHTADLSCNEHCRAAQCKTPFQPLLIGWYWDGSAMLSSAPRKWLWIGPGQLQGNAIRLELGKV